MSVSKNPSAPSSLPQPWPGFQPDPSGVHSEIIAKIVDRLDVLGDELDELVLAGPCPRLENWTTRLRGILMELYTERAADFPVLVLHAVQAAGQRLGRREALPQARLGRLGAARRCVVEELKPRCLGAHERDLIALLRATLSVQIGRSAKGTSAVDALAELALARATRKKAPDISDHVQEILKDTRTRGVARNSAPGMLRKKSFRARKSAGT